MSVLLVLSFALSATLAAAAMIRTWRQYGPQIARLRSELRRPVTSREIRLTVLEHAWVRLRPNRGPLRHMNRRKPVAHRLKGRTPRRAVA